MTEEEKEKFVEYLKQIEKDTEPWRKWLEGYGECQIVPD